MRQLGPGFRSPGADLGSKLGSRLGDGIGRGFANGLDDGPGRYRFEKNGKFIPDESGSPGVMKMTGEPTSPGNGGQRNATLGQQDPNCPTPEINAPNKITTPSTKLQQWAQQGGYVDPRTNKWIKFDGHLAADHVYPKDLIKKLDGFDKLTPQQQDFLLNYPGNFEPLPKSWNSSKLNRLADDWAKTPMGKQASKEHIDELRERQQAFEGFSKNLIEFGNR